MWACSCEKGCHLLVKETPGKEIKVKPLGHKKLGRRFLSMSALFCTLSVDVAQLPQCPQTNFGNGLFERSSNFLQLTLFSMITEF
jgi:hypothetical protein